MYRKNKPIQRAFDSSLEEEEQQQDNQLQRLKSVFQRYRDAKCPVKKAHPQSVTSLAKTQADRMIPVLDKYGDDATIEGMERFCEEQFWLEKGLPLNAFYKFQERWIEDRRDSESNIHSNQSGYQPTTETEVKTDNGSSDYSYESADRAIIARQQLISQIQLAAALAIRRGDTDSESYFMRSLGDIKPKDCPKETIKEVSEKVEGYLNT